MKKTIHSRIRHFWRAGLVLPAAAALSFAACSDDGESKKQEFDPSQLTAQALDSKIALASQTGCLIDSDCVTGNFCFQGICAAECAKDGDCASDDSERCSAQGRCISKAKEAKKRLTRAGSSEATALTEEQSAAVAAEIPTVKVIELPEERIEVIEGAEKTTVKIKTDKAVPDGALLYRVEVGGLGAGQALRAVGSDAFTFELPTGKAALAGEAATLQQVNLVTSVGGWLINVVPKVKTAGIYEGTVSLDQFGGAKLPLKFALEVEPRYAATLAEVTSMKLALPASLESLFSPESVEATATGERWVRLSMKKEQAANCQSQGGCYSASFSSNDFHQGASALFGGNQLNRAIRIEISALDLANKRVQGFLRDSWKGIFRTANQGSNLEWATVISEGDFLLTRVNGLAVAADAMTDHEAKDPVNGDLSEALSLARCEALGAYQPVDTSCPETLDALKAADGATLATCANDLAAKLLGSGDLTSELVLAYMGENPPAEPTFADFLKDCADSAKDTCASSPALLCASDLLARAYQRSSGTGATAQALMANWQKLSREAYLGRQLAAFQNDVTARIDWLQSSEVPQILASAFRDYNAGILDAWEKNVLDAHFGVLGAQFSPHSMETLARTSDDPAIQSARNALLQDQASSWEGAMDALQLAATRWNDLYTDAANREFKAASVRTRMIDLYTAAVILGHLNKAADNSAANAAFGTGFTALLGGLQKLSLSFNDLAFLRDAEVTVPRSVDPLSNSNTLLSERKKKATDAVTSASKAIGAVLDAYQKQQVSQATLASEMATQQEELAGELVNLCGLPTGCTVAMFRAGACDVSVEMGMCGFSYSIGATG